MEVWGLIKREKEYKSARENGNERKVDVPLLQRTYDYLAVSFFAVWVVLHQNTASTQEKKTLYTPHTLHYYIGRFAGHHRATSPPSSVVPTPTSSGVLS